MRRLAFCSTGFMLSDQDYSILGFTESIIALDRCVDDFRLTQERMTDLAIETWDAPQIKIAIKKLLDCNRALTSVLDASYKKLHTARIKLYVKDIPPGTKASDL